MPSPVPTKAPRRARSKAARRRPASLHAAVLVKVRNMITTGELAPGAHLTERVLTDKLRVSRTPLREALKILAHEGLVELLPNCGARVTRLTAENARLLFEVIEALESQAGRLACERITGDELADLRRVHLEMHAHFLRRELPEYFELNQSIHEKIVAAARNPILETAHRLHSSRIRRARYQEIQVNEKRWREAMQEHEQIIDALERRDAPELADILKYHLHRMFENAYQKLIAPPSTP
jgi:DNA-binding GntR family transcriptional regulator